MASRFPTETIFDRISLEISKTFNELIKQLTLRRDQLLAEVEMRRNEFEQRMKAQRETLKTLENIRRQIEQLNTQQNPASNQIQSSLVPFQKQIDEIIQPPNFKFECPTRMIAERLKNVGSILLNDAPISINYPSKVKATQLIKCSQPSFLYAHLTDFYVISRSPTSDSVIQVFDTNDWSSKHVIQKENMLPKAVVADKLHCYVVYSDSSNRNALKYLISKIDKTTLNIIQSEVLVNCNVYYIDIVGATISEIEIFIADQHNGIRVFDKNLNYRRRLELNQVRCIQFKDGKLYALDGNISLSIFNSSFQKIGSSHQFFRPSTNQSEGQARHRMISFCLDPSGNAILASENKIVVQSPNGEELYTIGTNCQCNEDISGCSCILAFGGKILVACRNLNSIKIF